MGAMSASIVLYDTYRLVTVAIQVDVQLVFFIFGAAIVLYIWLKAVSFASAVLTVVRQSDVGSVVGS